MMLEALYQYGLSVVTLRESGLFKERVHFTSKNLNEVLSTSKNLNEVLSMWNLTRRSFSFVFSKV